MNTPWKHLAGVAALGLTVGVPASAQQISVRVNGESVSFIGAQPAQIQGRLLVPLRGVLEQMGASLIWDPATRTVIGSRGNRRFELPIGGLSARVNNATMPLDVPAQIVRGTTMVPLRFVSEALGADVRWNGATQTVEIGTEPVFGENGDGRGRDPGGRGVTDELDDLDSEPRRLETDTEGRNRNRGRLRTNGQGRRNPNRDTSELTRPEERPIRPGRITSSTNANAADPVIQSFSHSANGPLRADSILQVEMEGTPGGQATFDVVGVGDTLPMKEVQPGRYTGQLKMRRGLNVQNARVFGRLTVGGKSAPIVQAGTPLNLDAQPPQILGLNPATGSTVNRARPDIYAEFRSDGVADIERASVQIRVNGKDVTPDARITPGFIFYEPTEDLRGSNTVEIRATDRAGNVQVATTTFQVSPQAGGLTAVTHNAEKPLVPGEVLTVTARGAPGGTAMLTLAGVVEGIRMAESSPGVYTGSYTVKPEDKAYNVPVDVKFASSSSPASSLKAAQPVSLSGGRLTRPLIIEPKPKDKLKDAVTVMGRAEPGTTVRVTLSTSGRLFGVLAIEGSNITQEAQVDKSGIFKTDPLPLSRPAGAKDVKYTIEVVAVDPLGRTSPPMSIVYSNQ